MGPLLPKLLVWSLAASFIERASCMPRVLGKNVEGAALTGHRKLDLHGRGFAGEAPSTEMSAGADPLLPGKARLACSPCQTRRGGVTWREPNGVSGLLSEYISSETHKSKYRNTIFICQEIGFGVGYQHHF